jgi:GT2 family glycosyltransferase
MSTSGEAPRGASRLAVILVHYHAPGPLAAAVEALERDLDASGIAAEWRVVDNGSTEEERAELQELGLPLIDGGGNLGFAAGVNRGVASTAAESLLVLNPDVVVLPGCVRGLLDELESGAGAAAPRLYWDRDRRFLLPPGEERSRRWELLRLLAKRSDRCAARARRRSRLEARRHWEASGSLRSARLSGAALAISRAAWARVGAFDEGYRLYFEETDWLLRLEVAGLEARQAAAAEAVHAFAHSTKDEPRATTWFEESARRFQARHYGRWFAGLHRRLARAAADPGRGGVALPFFRPDTLGAIPGVAAGRSFWLELSPNREGFPAAGERIAGADLGRWRPPFALMRASGLDGMSLCLTTEAGRELGWWWVEG